MSADLINPTGVDVGGLQVDDPAIQGFLALLEADIQKGRHLSSLSDSLVQVMLDKSMGSIDLAADIEGNVAPHAAAERAQKQGPQGSESNANVRLFAALSKLIFEAVPSDPNREEYRQGNTMGAAFRHWRRAKIGRRFQLFFSLRLESPDHHFCVG